jgi:hypothetical protein
MSSSSMCQTVYDTLRTVIYDTVHTSVFDTVHTVSFDTVHSLVYDSAAVTVQALRDSQTFYQDAFNNLLTVFGFAITIATFFVTVFSVLKTNSDSRKLKTEFDATSSKVAQDAAKEIASQTKQKFEDAVKEQQTKLDSIKNETSKMLKTKVFSQYAFLVRVGNPVSALNGLCSLLNKIGSSADDELLAFAVSSVLPEIENNFEKMGFCKGYDQLALWVEEEISRFSSSITEQAVSDDGKHDAIEYINKIDSKIKQKLSEFNKINRGEDPVRSGRFYTSPKNRPDTKSRKK